MHRLVRITSNDYRNFRRAYEKIDYSFFKKGEEEPWVSEQVRELNKNFIKGKGEFLDEVENPKKELYFLEVDGEIKGIVELIFEPDFCNIYQFSVFEHGKGLGTTFYQEVLKIIQEHKSRKIVLFCPYEGAECFWRKQGFKQKSNAFFEKRIKS